ncbi:MAG: FliA/WhiG family RNA polymerase sigma factor [Deltaproteobacteria bacterium]|nr:FliA/WhiG family RNA polymerase sigma factor [Deltaproteobacteria bacterium]
MTPLRTYQACSAAADLTATVIDRDALVKEFLPAIKYHAARIKMRVPPNIEMDDLVSSGVVGLLDAVDRFDPSRGIKFKTYADFRIRGTMLDHLREMDWFPRSIRQYSSRLQNAYARLEGLLGRPPEEQEVAVELRISVDELRRQLAMFAGLSVLSLDVPQDECDGAAAGILYVLSEAAKDEAREEELLRDIKEILSRAIDTLPERERHLIALYYYEDLTMREISEIFRLGEPRICQLHAQAVLRLRGKLSAEFAGN